MPGHPDWTVLPVEEPAPAQVAKSQSGALALERALQKR
jgi:hypothetical protein